MSKQLAKSRGAGLQKNPYYQKVNLQPVDYQQIETLGSRFLGSWVVSAGGILLALSLLLVGLSKYAAQIKTGIGIVASIMLLAFFVMLIVKFPDLCKWIDRVYQDYKLTDDRTNLDAFFWRLLGGGTIGIVAITFATIVCFSLVQTSYQSASKGEVPVSNMAAGAHEVIMKWGAKEEINNIQKESHGTSK